MNTYYIDGYRIAARSMAQARFAAVKLAEADAPREREDVLRCFECGVRVASLSVDSRCWRCTSSEDFE